MERQVDIVIYVSFSTMLDIVKKNILEKTRTKEKRYLNIFPMYSKQKTIDKISENYSYNS